LSAVRLTNAKDQNSTDACEPPYRICIQTICGHNDLDRPHVKYVTNQRDPLVADSRTTGARHGEWAARQRSHCKKKGRHLEEMGNRSELVAAEPNPSEKFGRFKWLRHIVICTKLQSDDFVDGLTARALRANRCADSCLARSRHKSSPFVWGSTTSDDKVETRIRPYRTRQPAPEAVLNRVTLARRRFHKAT